MKIRLCSDLHLEFFYDLFDTLELSPRARQHFNTVLPHLPGDRNTVLVVAGDLATVLRPNRILSFLNECVNRFQRVIYVLGNHEHYNYSFHSTLPDLYERCDQAGLPVRSKQLLIAGNQVETLQLDDVGFVCGTLWTDFNRGDPATELACLRAMRDFSVITSTNGEVGQFIMDDIKAVNRLSVDTIRSALADNLETGLKSVVVSHHLPSTALVDPRYKQRERDLLVNGAFASEQDWLMKDYSPALWLYGHTHTPTDTQIYDTRCVCNPVGYPDERNIAERRFNPGLVIEL